MSIFSASECNSGIWNSVFLKGSLHVQHKRHYVANFNLSFGGRRLQQIDHYLGVKKLQLTIVGCRQLSC